MAQIIDCFFFSCSENFKEAIIVPVIARIIATQFRILSISLNIITPIIATYIGYVDIIVETLEGSVFCIIQNIIINPMPCNAPIEHPINESLRVKFSGKFNKNKNIPMIPWLSPTNKLKLLIERLNSDNTLLSVILTMAKIIGFKIEKIIQSSKVLKSYPLTVLHFFDIIFSRPSSLSSIPSPGLSPTLIHPSLSRTYVSFM